LNRWLAIILFAGFSGCARFQPHPISPAESAAQLDARSLNDSAFKTFLEKNLHTQFTSWPLKRWDFETLNLAALFYHPSLDVARAQWRTSEGGETTAAQRPNPNLNVAPGYDVSASGGLTPWFPAVNLDIPIETMGKRRYRKAQAAHLSESSRLNIITAAWQVRANLRASLIDFTAAREREKLLQNQLAVQKQIVKSLEQQLLAGAVTASELTLVRIALGKIQLDLTDARRQSADARGRVADAIGVSVKALRDVELAYDLKAIPRAAASLTSSEARNQALRGRADILASLADYAATQSALQLEIAKQYPDIHLGPGYQYDQGEHKISLSIAVDLPVFNQNQGPIAEAEGKRAEAAARFNALQAKTLGDIDRALVTYRVTRENLSTLESLASAQKKQYAAVQAQMNAGAAAKTDLLNSQIELGAGELIQLDGRVKLQQAFAALEDALQRPIDSMNPSLSEQPQRPQARKDKQP
jgi:cobalt-zinc-cadmium efflux system outer membrane protein